MLVRIPLFAALAAVLLALPALAQRSTPLQLLDPAGPGGGGVGNSMAIDGDTMILGGKSESAHVYRWAGSAWVLEATLTAPGPSIVRDFGISVAISGDTAVVGADYDTVGANNLQGAVYVYVRTGTTWTYQATLTDSGGAADRFFGFSVGISGNTVIAGCYADTIGVNPYQGSASIFVRSGTTWTQQARLIAADGAAADWFGKSVSVSGDTAIVGSYRSEVGANTDQGAAYVFVRSGTTWSEQAKLTASDGAAFDRLGDQVVISGDTAMVGARSDDVGANADQGSAYVFVRSGTTWSQQAKLTASDGAAGDSFASSLAISGNTAIVGASNDDVGSNADQGSAYVFVRSGATWTQQAKLIAPDGAASDGFGTSVAVSGDTAMVGVPLDDVGANLNQGSVWIFSRVGPAWIGADRQLVASDGAAGDFYGYSVAISGDTAIVGASNRTLTSSQQGSAYVYVRSGMSWIQQTQLTASDSALGDFLGTSVAISGDTAIVGAYGDDVGANSNQGSAYVFVRSGTTWTQQAKLTASDGAASDFFGYAAAISGDTAIIGAYGDDISTNADRGSAYVFVRSGTTWTQQAKITASDGAAADFFGWSVALDGNTAVVGASNDNLGANADQGSAYVFVRSGTTWTQQAKLTASDGAASDFFGSSVALSGNTAIAGAQGTNSSQGAAYIFVRSGTTWTQQAKLTASDGAASDTFGRSVALSGDTAVIGADLDDIGANVNRGSAYVFSRVVSAWTERTKLTAPDGGGALDRFGFSVALSGDYVIAGAYGVDVGANTNQGSAWVFNVVAQDLSFARNDDTAVGYSTLGAAVSPATTGQQITATEAAWRTAASLDTAGRDLTLRSGADIRTPSTTALVLGGSSTLIAPSGSVAEIFGPLSVTGNQAATILADSFRLGSRGSLRLFTGAWLSINGSQVQFDGPAQLDPGSRLSAAGAVVLHDDLTAQSPLVIESFGGLTNNAVCSLTNTTVNTPSFTNAASLSSQGTSTFEASYVNNAAATTNASGTFLVQGSFINNGTFIGAACPSCPSAAPKLEVWGDLTLAPEATLKLPVAGATFRMEGNFDSALNNNTRYDLSQATLQFENGFPVLTEQTLEVMSRDVGPSATGLNRNFPGHYPIGTLRIGQVTSLVRLVDNHDNDGLGQGSCEAIYVDTLQIDTYSRLINPACRIYYNTLINNGTIDFPANVIPLAPPCPGDLNGDTLVDDADFVIFATAYNILDCADPAMAPGCPADLNADLFVDDADFVLFANAYNELLCP
ncbi:MAG: hypothetical protein K2Y21_00250 [Phycisphaerales bacterium]|nr:hypothetical protein [Phycisphaerales bacterium]